MYEKNKGKIVDVIENTLPTDRPLEIRDSKEFISVSQRVREGLRSGHSYEWKYFYKLF